MQHDIGNMLAVELSVAADWAEASYRYPLHREVETHAARDIIDATLCGDTDRIEVLMGSHDHARVMRRIKRDLPRLCGEAYTLYHEVQEGFA